MLLIVRGHNAKYTSQLFQFRQLDIVGRLCDQRGREILHKLTPLIREGEASYAS